MTQAETGAGLGPEQKTGLSTELEEALEVKETHSGGVNKLFGGGEMGALIRRFDWSSTALGPIETWATSLQTAVNICLNSRFPMVIWWGQELVLLYNDAWQPILGTKHPQALGQP
ncbi:MAG TPA: hypothetical protein V6D06_05645, partial [Trichocoleus sp.]